MLGCVRKIRCRVGVARVLATLFVVLPADAALALGSEPPAVPEPCQAAATEAAVRHGIPPSVLTAIAMTETGRRVGGRIEPWPWAVNIAGKGFWFDTRAEAEGFIHDRFAEGRRNFDTGCFQINYRWHPDAHETPVSMFDPVTSADYAARFLRALFEETGDWSRAAGFYHSRNAVFATRYRQRFDRLRSAHLHLDGPDETPVLRRDPGNAVAGSTPPSQPGSLFIAARFETPTGLDLSRGLGSLWGN